MPEKYIVSSKAPMGLYLRSEPIVVPATKIAILPMGHAVTKIAEASAKPWWQVSTEIAGNPTTGYVNSTFLIKDSSYTPPQPANTIKPVHLPVPSGTTVTPNKKLWAYPLNESGQPKRDPSDTPANRIKQLTGIIKHLKVKTSARYAATSTSTYCNIYAYDYCYLGSVYLPRVWWNQQAILKLKAGASVSPIYGQTVDEINANSLYNWLRDWGNDYGWDRVTEVTEMQKAANNGQVAIICAKNKTPNKSGHICAVVPETSNDKATYNGTTVVIPLQSQAGRSNYDYFARTWWTMNIFSNFGFWINTA